LVLPVVESVADAAVVEDAVVTTVSAVKDVSQIGA